MINTVVLEAERVKNGSYEPQDGSMLEEEVQRYSDDREKSGYFTTVVNLGKLFLLHYIFFLNRRYRYSYYII